MADKVDGSIRFETEVDTKGMEGLAESVKNAADESKKEVADFAKDVTNAMKSELADFGKNLSEGIVDSVKEAMDGAAQAAQTGAQDATDAVDQTITDAFGDDAVADLGVGDILDGIVNKLSETDGLIGGIAGAVQNIGAGNVLGVLGGINQAIDSLPHGLQLVLGALSGNPIYLMKAIPGIISDIVGGIGRLGTGLKSLVLGVGQRLVSGIKSLVSGGGGGGLLGGLASAINRVKSTILSVMIFNQLSKALRSFTDNVGSALYRSDAFANAMARLKGNIVTAFMPIWDVAVPALTALVNALAKAAGWAAQLTATLFGKTVKAAEDAAVAFNNQSDAAAGAGTAAKDAAKDTTKAAKETAKASDKFLASFDTIEKISSPSASGGGGAAGSDGSTITGTALAVKAEDLFDPNAGNDLVSKFAEAIKTADWSAVGAAISAKLTGIFSNLGSLVDWEVVGPKIESLAKKIGSFLKGVDWPAVLGSAGTALGKALSTIIKGLGTFIAAVPWDKVASGVAKFFKNVFANMDWDGINAKLQKALSSVIKGLNTFFREFDWTGLGNTLGKAASTVLKLLVQLLKDTDWGKLFKGVVSTLVTAVKTLLVDTNWKNVWLAIKNVLKGLMEAGGAIWKGLQEIAGTIAGLVFDGIKEKVAGKNFGQILVDAFNTAKSGLKGVLNAIIGGLEFWANKLIDAINAVIRGIGVLGGGILNLVGLKAPKEIGHIGLTRISALAEGAVIPPNREFMAILGDQQHGTNLEAPEGLIRKIVREESGGSAEMLAVLQGILAAVRSGSRIELNGRELGRAVRRELGNTGRASGVSVIPT